MAAGGPSEFTRVLGRMPPGGGGPAMPPAPKLPPAAAPKAPAPTPVIAPHVDAAAPEKQSYLPLIIALNVILIGAIVLVAYLVMKK
jgi:hypothetical protein